MRLLLEVSESEVVQRFELTKDSYLLGRGSSCDLIIRRNSVSRIHAELVNVDGSWYIEDRGGRNGVFVNGNRTCTSRLSSGDRIQLSRTTTFLFIDEADEVAALNAILANLGSDSRDRELARIEEITSKITALESMDEILQVALAEAVSFVGAQRGFIALAEHEGKLSDDTYVTHNLPEGEKGYLTNVSSSVVEEAINGCSKVIVTNTAAREVSVSTSIFDLQLRAVMCFPLQVAGRLVGVLYVDSGNELDPFSDRHQYFFRLLADNTAIVIENVKLVERLKTLNSRLAERVRESEARYEQLVEVSPDSILLVVDEEIVFANPASISLMAAQEREEVIGKRVSEIFSDPKILEYSVVNTGKGSKTTILTDLQGDTHDVEIMIASLDNDEKGAQLVVARDVTARRQMEAELQKTEKLESLSTLAGGLAHDFNNLLAAIMGNVSMAASMLAGQKNQDIVSRLGECEEACERASSLTQQLLTFSNGGAPIKRVTKLDQLVQGTVRFALSGTKVKANFDVPEDLWQSEVDKTQLVQAINSVVSNAVDAMPEGGNLFVVGSNACIPADSPLAIPQGHYVSIELTDEGPGIPDDLLCRIFDPFYTTKEDSSGLGLSTTYSIINRHGGTVHARKGDKGGTTLTIYLPAVRENAKRNGDESDFQNFSGKVLVMDDENAIVSMARAMVSTMGLNADVAFNGEEAIEMYQRALGQDEPYSAVIMDLTVPGGMGGAEAIRVLKDLDPAIRAIVSSGYSNDAVMSNYRDHGFIGVLEKPYGLRKLQSVLGDVLSRKIAV